MQGHFDALIRERVSHFSVNLIAADLPKLDSIAPFSEERPGWFAVPGMYGGFAYWLRGSGEATRVVTESWSRVIEGSGQRHEIDAIGSKLVAEGFV